MTKFVNMAIIDGATMASQIPSFLNGSKVSIRIGDAIIAYAQGLSITDDMRVTPVGGIGSFSSHTLEPTDYIARGSMTITHYSDMVRNAILASSGNGTAALPGNLTGTTPSLDADGNSFLKGEYFNPIRLITSMSFDISVFERTMETVNPIAGTVFNDINNLGVEIYTIKNCRLASYSIGFTPGSMVMESVSFLATVLEDKRSE